MSKKRIKELEDELAKLKKEESMKPVTLFVAGKGEGIIQDLVFDNFDESLEDVFSTRFFDETEQLEDLYKVRVTIVPFTKTEIQQIEQKRKAIEDD